MILKHAVPLTPFVVLYWLEQIPFNIAAHYANEHFNIAPRQRRSSLNSAKG